MSDAVSFLLSVYLNISSTVNLEPFSKFLVIIYLHIPKQKSHIFLKKTISIAKSQIVSYIVFNRYKNPVYILIQVPSMEA